MLPGGGGADIGGFSIRPSRPILFSLFLSYRLLSRSALRLFFALLAARVERGIDLFSSLSGELGERNEAIWSGRRSWWRFDLMLLQVELLQKK